MNHPYRTYQDIHQLEGWRPRIPRILVRTWHSKHFRYHACAWASSAAFHIGGQFLILSLLGRHTMPEPFAWGVVIPMFFGGMLLLRLAWALLMATERTSCPDR